MATKEIELTYTRNQVEIFFPNPEDERKFNVITKGRRFGATHGAAHAYIDKLVGGEGPFLWGDTIHGNIDRYFDRYFLPALKKNDIDYHFDKKNKQLKIGAQYMDFRSADKPENWEGFGYKEIFLNEAGIILNNDYLYTNAILPMLLDFEDSKLIAAGVPKGKLNKKGGEHKFYTLYKQSLNNPSKYRLLQYSSYDNPLLKAQDIKELEQEISLMDPQMVEQEIYGKFVEATAHNPFASQYSSSKHEALVTYNPSYPVHFSIDFNYDPFGAIAFQMWTDSRGEHLHVINEYSISGGTIQNMSAAIKQDYGNALHLSTFTGDYGGTHKQIGHTDNRSLFAQLKDELRVSKNQFKLTPNPTHKTSRSDCNYFLLHFPDFKINPDTCAGTCRDMRVVQVNAKGEIVKRNRQDVSQLSDHLDCFRYIVNTHYKPWIKRHQTSMGFGK